MKKTELILLKKELNKEIERRETIKELLNVDLVMQFANLTGVDYKSLTNYQKMQLIEEILKTMTITEDNGIYVLTKCQYLVPNYDGDFWMYLDENDFQSKNIEVQEFKNVETGRKKLVYLNHEKEFYGTLLSEFKQDTILLNPTNTPFNENGYNEVRYDFFTNVVEIGQPKTKKLILEKYTRI